MDAEIKVSPETRKWVDEALQKYAISSTEIKYGLIGSAVVVAGSVGYLLFRKKGK